MFEFKNVCLFAIRIYSARFILLFDLFYTFSLKNFLSEYEQSLKQVEPSKLLLALLARRHETWSHQQLSD